MTAVIAAGIKWGHFCGHKSNSEMKTIIEPFKIKSVEPIFFNSPEERKQILQNAFMVIIELHLLCIILFYLYFRLCQLLRHLYVNLTHILLHRLSHLIHLSSNSIIHVLQAKDNLFKKTFHFDNPTLGYNVFSFFFSNQFGIFVRKQRNIGKL